MPKKALSVTLGEDNLLWLRGRASSRKKRSLSDALDDILTEARQGGRGASPARSVVGTLDIGHEDPMLEHADAYVRTTFDQSLQLDAERPVCPSTTSRWARKLSQLGAR